MKYLLFLLVLWGSVSDGQVICTIAGGGTNLDGYPATSSRVCNPNCILFDKYGNLYISELSCNVIRKVGTNGIISTIAGTGAIGFNGDDIFATFASLSSPEGIAIDSSGNIYISDHMNSRVRRIDIVTNVISTYAGSGVIGDTGDGGYATNAKIFPCDIAFDRLGNLYISDNTYHKIRKVDGRGIITTYAGVSGAGYSGDGGMATNAKLSGPTSLCISSNSDLYFVDGLNKRIRKVDSFGIITTIAGNGNSIFNGDGISATSAQIAPLGVAIDVYNNIYI